MSTASIGYNATTATCVAEHAAQQHVLFTYTHAAADTRTQQRAAFMFKPKHLPFVCCTQPQLVPTNELDTRQGAYQPELQRQTSANICKHPTISAAADAMAQAVTAWF
jgi:hypothetical protein